jgi:hypothetical protein
MNAGRVCSGVFPGNGGLGRLRCCTCLAVAFGQLTRRESLTGHADGLEFLGQNYSSQAFTVSPPAALCPTLIFPGGHPINQAARNLLDVEPEQAIVP